MGQEASMPQENGEEGLDPPSQVPPPNVSIRQQGMDGHHHARPGKALKNMFQRHGDQGSFHGKESARAAAENGHFENIAATPSRQLPLTQQQLQNHQYQNQNPARTAEQEYYRQQQQHHQIPPQQHYGAQHQHAAAVVPPSPASPLSPQQFPVVGVMYASGQSPNRSVSGRGGRGRGLINSMRNLSIGSRITGAPTGPEGNYKTTGLGQPEAVNDWETRWDEDDDDSEGDDEDAKPTSNGMLVNQPLRPGMDVAHSTLPAPAKRPSEPLIRFDDQPVSSMQPELISIQPTKVEEGILIPTGSDELAQQAMDGLAWDVGVALPQEEQYEKPNLQMFLPLLRVLGKGSFGKVVLVQKRRGKETGGLFAMKILRKTHLVKRRQIERTQTERKVLSVVDHPFIMKLHYAFQSDDKLYLVLDYCPGGELFFHLSRFRRFPERVARFYAAELLLAIGHLHKRGIIYRDLKPENVLLDADGHVKLGDFGLAKAGIRHPCEGALSMCGTPEYMAPEVLSQAGHGFGVDYWGLGMLVYEMMTGLPPWYTTDRAKLFRRLKSAPLDIPTYFSVQSANCVSALLERNPRRRLGVTGIRPAMEHEFFRSINWRALYARRVEAPIRPCEGWKASDVTTDAGSAQNGSASPWNDDIGTEALDKATANFDNSFTRMPVETEDGPSDGNYSDEGETEELHADTFIGFTFDEKLEEANDVSAPSRPRTHYE